MPAYVAVLIELVHERKLDLSTRGKRALIKSK